MADEADRLFQGRGADCRFRQSRMLPSSVNKVPFVAKAFVDSTSSPQLAKSKRGPERSRNRGERRSGMIQRKTLGVGEVGERFSCCEHVGRYSTLVCWHTKSQMSCQCLNFSLGNEWRCEGALSSRLDVWLPHTKGHSRHHTYMQKRARGRAREGARRGQNTREEQ